MRSINLARLIWDDWNINHIAQHLITPDDVEEVCQNDPMINDTYAGRLRVVGLTVTGRAITAILAPKDDEGSYYPVTARAASKKERELFRGEVEARDREAA